MARKQMDRGYWEDVAQDYDGEIFDVLANDRNGVVKGLASRVADSAGVAGDLGCGTGKATPWLASLFSRVEAMDLSARCLGQARKRCHGLDNVTFHRGDLSLRPPFPGKLDFVLNVNVVLTAAPSKRRKLLANLAACLKRGGHLLLVVPALESALLSAVRLAEWETRDGASPEAAQRAIGRVFGDRFVAGIEKGLIFIDGVPTKHYLREELEVLASGLGLGLVDVQKVAYGWHTEFATPPRWMREPYPWDWAVLMRRS